MLILGFLGPQFIYQIRPHTFFISGLAVGAIVLLILAGTIFQPVSSRKQILSIGSLLVAYALGFYLPYEIVQWLIFGLSILLVLYFIMTNPIRSMVTGSIVGAFVVSAMVFWGFSTPVIFHEAQAKYEDKVLFTTETQFHQLAITQWKNDYWFYIDQLKNLSSIDEYLYYEPMVHSVFTVADDVENALVIGGENGCLIREVLKHPELQRVDVLSYDSLLRNLAMENPYFTRMNKDAFSDNKVHIIHEDLLSSVSNATKKYDAIFIDLPDPRNIETNQYYTIEFYQLIKKMLRKDGVMITQAGSSYFATEAFYTIGQTLQKSGFSPLPLHNQILTLGEWGWYLCKKDRKSADIHKKLLSAEAPDVDTRWYNQDAARLITAFGKTHLDTMHVHVNSLDNPLVYQYYLKGNWRLD